jgi:hypothetical protein
MRQFLVSVEEEFYTAETWFFGFELETPFYAGDGGFGAAALFGGECCVGGRRDGGGCLVGDFGGDFVGGYAVASWPSFCVRVELASLWWYGGVAVGCFSHVLMISMSSGFALYAAATLLRFVSCMIRCKMMHLSFNSPGICGAKVYSDNYSVRRNLNMFIRISIAIDDRRRS